MTGHRWSWRAAWHRIDDERRHALARTMRPRPLTANAAIARMEADGATWLLELGQRRGIADPLDAVTELEALISATTVPNMIGAVNAGALTPADAIRAGVGAGLGIGILVGHDHGAALVETRLAHLPGQRETLRQRAEALEARNRDLEQRLEAHGLL